MANRFLTADDRRELFDALIVRFRCGEIGPITLRVHAREIGISDDDITAARDKYIDECTDNMMGMKR